MLRTRTSTCGRNNKNQRVVYLQSMMWCKGREILVYMPMSHTLFVIPVRDRVSYHPARCLRCSVVHHVHSRPSRTGPRLLAVVGRPIDVLNSVADSVKSHGLGMRNTRELGLSFLPIGVQGRFGLALLSAMPPSALLSLAWAWHHASATTLTCSTPSACRRRESLEQLSIT